MDAPNTAPASDILQWLPAESDASYFDKGYQLKQVILRWSITVVYILLGLTGILPINMLALAGSTAWLVVISSLSTWHWHRGKQTPWYDASFMYLDLAAVFFILLATANLDYPIWMALVMVMIQPPTEEPTLRTQFFNIACVGAYVASAVILWLAGWFEVAIGVAVVTTVMLTFISINLSNSTDGSRRLRKIIARMAVTDSLTGLANRRQLSRMLANPPENKPTTAVIVMDVDRFKDYNDTYGHLAGDKLLSNLATVLGDWFPDAQTLARYGGDEFVVLLPCDSIRAASLRVQEMLEGRSRERVPVSVGIAMWPDDHHTMDAAFAAADDALRAAKRSKRGTYATADGEGHIRLSGAA